MQRDTRPVEAQVRHVVTEVRHTIARCWHTFLGSLARLERVVRALMLGIAPLAVVYCLIWVHSKPAWYLTALWVVLVTVLFLLSFVQAMIFAFLPRRVPEESVGYDLFLVLALYVISIFFFATIYFTWSSEFGIPTPTEVIAMRSDLEKIDQWVQSDEFRRAEAEELRARAAQRKIFEEAPGGYVVFGPVWTVPPQVSGSAHVGSTHETTTVHISTSSGATVSKNSERVLATD